MATWHGYIALANINLDATQRTAFRNALIAYFQANQVTTSIPAETFHYVLSSDGTKDVFEALYDTDNLTLDTFKTLLAGVLGVDAGDVNDALATVFMDSQSTPEITLLIGVTDYIRYAFVSGVGSEWGGSRTGAVAFLRYGMTGDPVPPTWAELFAAAEVIDYAAETGDFYFIGRVVRERVYQLFVAYQTTLDTAYLDEWVRIMDIAAAQLATSTRGHNIWIEDFESENQGGGEIASSEKDAIFCGTLIALTAYVLGNVAGYETPAAFWLDNLTNHFIAEFAVDFENDEGYAGIAEVNFGMFFRLLHPLAAQMVFHWLVYQLTADEDHNEDYAYCKTRLLELILTDSGDGGYYWNHYEAASLQTPENFLCQPSQYANATMSDLVMAYELSIPGFDDTFMTPLAATVLRYVTLADGITTVAGDVCGVGVDTGNRWRYLAPCAMAWDISGELQTRAAIHYKALDAAIPAAMLYIGQT